MGFLFGGGGGGGGAAKAQAQMQQQQLIAQANRDRAEGIRRSEELSAQYEKDRADATAKAQADVERQKAEQLALEEQKKKPSVGGALGTISIANFLGGGTDGKSKLLGA